MKKKYGKYILLGLSCALVMAVVAFFLVARKNNNQKPAGEFYTVKKGDITNFTEQTGILKAQVGAIVKVGTRATGTLMFMKYQIGDSVKKGELIAQIDDREIVANIRKK
jgi:multidrug efflux pump subunit AcrA (membrane-fusion protein)